jgi:hypothetical protein
MWRNYFMSAYAHCTIVEDKVWRQPRGTTDVSAAGDADGIHFSARFDTVNVTRLVDIPRDRAGIEVSDIIVHSGPHSILWQMGVDIVSVDRVADGDAGTENTTCAFDLTSVTGRRFRLTMTTDAPPPADRELVEVIEGQDRPLLGWYSPWFGTAVPQPVIRFNVDVPESVRVVTRLSPQ